jgi:hypothetical protein
VLQLYLANSAIFAFMKNIYSLKSMFGVILYSSFFTLPVNAQTINWAQKFSSTSNTYIRKMVTDHNKNLFTIGVFEGNISFDSAGVSKDITSLGNKDTYIAKVNKHKDLLWAVNIGSDQDDISPGLYMGLDIDSNGNVYSLSTFKATATVNSTAGNGSSITSSGGFDIFLSKHDANGALIWVLKIGGAGDDASYGIKVKNGAVYLCGSFTSTCTFNTTSGASQNLVSAGGDDAFVAKYDLNGVLDWATRGGGSGLDVAVGIDVANNGEIYVAGNFGCCGALSVTLGNSTISNLGGWGGFVAKMNAAGQWIWANAMGQTQSEGVNAIISDDLGNVFAVGIFDKANTIITSKSSGTPITIVNNGGYDAVVLSFDTAGVYKWHKVIGSSARDYGYDIILNKRNNVVVGGQFANTVNFGGASLTSVGAWDGYVAEYDKNGNFISVIGAGGTTNDEVLCLTADSIGNVFAGGYFTGTASIGATSLVSTGGMESFVFGLSYSSSTNLKSDIRSLNAHQISVSPNPFVNYIVVNSDFVINDAYSISIYDLLGKMIYTQKYLHNNDSNNSTLINLENLHLLPGTYIIDMHAGDKHYKSRLIKSN